MTKVRIHHFNTVTWSNKYILCEGYGIEMKYNKQGMFTLSNTGYLPFIYELHVGMKVCTFLFMFVSLLSLRLCSLFTVYVHCLSTSVVASSTVWIWPIFLVFSLHGTSCLHLIFLRNSFSFSVQSHFTSDFF